MSASHKGVQGPSGQPSLSPVAQRRARRVLGKQESLDVHMSVVGTMGYMFALRQKNWACIPIRNILEMIEKERAEESVSNAEMVAGDHH